MNSFFSAIGKKVRSYQGLDGSWDLTLGLLMMAGGFCIQIGQSYLMGPAVIAIHLAIDFIRSRVSQSRLGYFRLTQTRRLQEAILGLGITVTAILAYAVAIIAAKRFFPDHMFLILGIPSAAIVLMLGSFYGLRRFYLYAPLLLGGFTVMHFHRPWMPATLFICGLVITLVGIAVLCRFVRLHPASDGENPDE